MSFCHGNGDLARDGCCYVAGDVCPLRWKIVNGDILKGASLTNIGTPAEFAESASDNPVVQQHIIDHTTGVTYACSAAISVVVENPGLLNDREKFEAAWIAEPRYAAEVAPVWRAVEAKAGMPVGAMDCPTWGQNSVPQCCYAEDPATNEAKAADLPEALLALRRGGAGRV